MELNQLTAISPIDGRYRDKVKELFPYFSEFGLIRYRVFVEVEYFIALREIPLAQLESFDKSGYESLRMIYTDFSQEDALSVKKFESVTNHDVKAVEYFLKMKFDDLKFSAYKEFIHFGLTSQDVNNTAVPISIKNAMEEVYLPEIERLKNILSDCAERWKGIPMLARTHGQPASPTRLGKEIAVFAERIEKQLIQLGGIPYSAKFGGATGNFNAHVAAYPGIDWVGFANRFVNEQLVLDRSQTTTQIEHYDNLAALCDLLKRINTILIDLSRDIWTYISMEYFKQKIIKGEVGSSVMPHKVNPIDFENAEGNLGVANAIFEQMGSKLPVSRLQRDLTDSTVLRNIGVPMAHSLLALKSLQKGFSKLIVNEKKIMEDLNQNWAVITEAIQTILRREGYPEPYEVLKDLTRTNMIVTKVILHQFIDTLELNNEVKEELKSISPENYTGI